MSGQEEIELEPGDSPDHMLAAYFADARRTRRERYATQPRRRPRRRALITIVNDEAVFLPIWLGYYSRFFAPEDIYVLDNDSTDGSTQRDGFIRLPVSHDGLDNLWMVGQVQDVQRELLDRYELVVVTDVDEIVAPNPSHGTLGDYLDRFDERWVNCLGYEVVHCQDREQALRLDRPILSQRGYWMFDDVYNKPAISTEPLTWRAGFHGRADFHFNLDPDLRLIHLHRMDYELCRQRHMTRRQRPWAKLDAQKGWGAHNFITDEPEFHDWFYGGQAMPGRQSSLEPIPPVWRALL